MVEVGPRPNMDEGLSGHFEERNRQDRHGRSSWGSKPFSGFAG